MKQKILFTTLLLTCIHGWAEQRSDAEIVDLARMVLEQQAMARGNAPRVSGNLQIVEKMEGVSIVSAGKNGFAIITNDEEQIPVMGYSFSTYDVEKASDGFLWWKKSIDKAVASGTINYRRAVPSEYKSKVEPLIKTQWNQNEPYNWICPKKYGERCFTGCVPTAMAQILYYYHYPLQGIGTYNGFDFANTIFEWGNMLDTYYEEDYSPIQRDAIATLMYACGKAVNVKYGTNASSAYLSNAVGALKNYFGYNNPQYIQRKSYSGDWMSTLYNELSNSRPVIYEGSPSSGSNNQDSHAFIIDGYDVNGNVHINWGWGGEHDGYFNIDVLNPGNDDYSTDQGMIFNIRNYASHLELTSKTIIISGSREANASHTLTATIKNNGSAFNGTLHLFVSQSATSSGSSKSKKTVYIASNGTKDVSFSYTPTANGNYYLWLTADNAGKDIVGKIGLSIGEGEELIEFKDKTAEKLCVYYYDANGDNALSRKEAANVTNLESLSESVSSLDEISSFDELQYFTSLTSLPAIFQYNPSLTSITLPASLTTMAEEVFEGCPKLETVTFAQGSKITSIPNSAFLECTKLKTIILPEGLKNINESAFSSCTALETITLPETMQNIYTRAFEDCASLKTITMQGIKRIYGNAFLNCGNIEEIEFPEGLTSIGEKAFSECNKLKKVIFPVTLTSLGYWAFNCDNLEDVYVSWTENPYVDVSNTWIFASSKLMKLHVPSGTYYTYNNVYPWRQFYILQEGGNTDSNIIDFEDAVAYRKCIEAWDTNKDGYLSKDEAAAVTTLGETFKCNSDLTSFNELKYFTGLTEINGYAFEDCFNLQSIVIPCNVTTIGTWAFSRCAEISSISIPNSVTTIKSSAFQSCGLTSITIPSSVTSISENAFERCLQLASIVVDNGNPQYDSRNNCNAIITNNNSLIVGCKNTIIPSDVTSIGDGAFVGFKDLTSVTIPSSVKRIGHRAFWGCGLTSVTIPEGVTSIGNYAFMGCSELNSLIIPRSIASIAAWAFQYCDKLKEVSSYSLNPSDISESVFEKRDNTFTDATLYVPIGTKSKYLAKEGWKKFKNIVEKEGLAPLDDVTLTANNYTRVYGDDNPTFEFTVSDGTITSGTPTITCSATKTSPVGTYDIVIAKGTVSNSTVELVKGTLTITKAPLTISAGNYTKVESEANPTFTPTFSGFKNNETKSVLTKQPTVTTTATKTSPVGSYPVTVTGAEAQNYEISYQNGTLTVKKKAVLTARNYTRQYGDENPTFEYTVTGGTIDSGTPTITCSATKTSPVGTYDIVIAKGTVSNSTVELVKGTLTITKAPLTISAGNYTKEEGEANPTFTPTFSGFKNNETKNVLTKQPTITTTATTTSAAGSYPVTVSGAEAENYEISYQNGTLIVTEVDVVVVSANDYIRVYGEDNPTFDYTVSGGTIESGTPIVTCSATKTSPVGTYDIVIAKGTVSNRSVELVKGTLTITKAPLMVTAGTYKRKQGEENQEFTLTYEGFKNNETAAVLTKPVVASCEATATSEPGEYEVTLSDGEAQNYELTYVPGLLTIEARPTVDDLIPDEGDDNGGSSDYGSGDSSVDASTDLNETVVGNIYYCITPDAGGYDAEEGCLVINKAATTVSTELSAVDGQLPSASNGFRGLVFFVNAGRGKVKIKAETTGNLLLCVKIAGELVMSMAVEGKTTLTIPYDVSQPSEVLVYAGFAASSRSMASSTTEDALKIYSLEWESEPTAIGVDKIENGKLKIENYYDLNGRKVNGQLKKGVYIVGGRKRVVK